MKIASSFLMRKSISGWLIRIGVFGGALLWLNGCLEVTDRDGFAPFYVGNSWVYHCLRIEVDGRREWDLHLQAEGLVRVGGGFGIVLYASNLDGQGSAVYDTLLPGYDPASVPDEFLKPILDSHPGAWAETNVQYQGRTRFQVRSFFVQYADPKGRVGMERIQIDMERGLLSSRTQAQKPGVGQPVFFNSIVLKSFNGTYIDGNAFVFGSIYRGTLGIPD